MADAVLLALEAILQELRLLRQDLRGFSPVGDYMTSAEAAQLLGITPHALRAAAARGAIPHTRIGRRLRFKRADLVRR